MSATVRDLEAADERVREAERRLVEVSELLGIARQERADIAVEVMAEADKRRAHFGQSPTVYCVWCLLPWTIVEQYSPSSCVRCHEEDQELSVDSSRNIIAREF